MKKITLFVLLAVATMSWGQSTSDIVGTWVGTVGPNPVTLQLNADGTFTYVVNNPKEPFSTQGTYSSDMTTFIFTGTDGKDVTVTATINSTSLLFDYNGTSISFSKKQQ